MTVSRASTTRKDVAKRRIGVRAGQPLSREIKFLGVPTLSEQAEGHISDGAIVSRQGTPRGQRPCACTEPQCARTGSSHVRASR
ncbi:hypothetical protein FEAC_29870 [Ferrimicrobium acidiphilum DSM 19497]|uniref:Uncharacterized protein n=1 Tax=Ferrimicrobium acidiphilum DSM 19497 TaxID=1121877 RepID=A0A0D8FPS5_9ACTN|nr:hypothetical protein FEAC_29870 [Ferrimicrobium acidiphilum DSM 19497]